jgi:hypothetical protein
VRPIKLFCVLFLVLWLPVTAFAQLRKYGPPRQFVDTFLTQQARQHATLTLPFWDDFSFAKGYPVDLLWSVNTSVFVNDGQGINPPSINVATFDGYDENGLPYSTVAEETGYGDTLESQPIDLTAVLPQHRDSIYLSFFYQAGGNSDIPNPGDFLRLEFKSTEGWVEIYKFEVKSTTDPTIFYDTAIQIPEAIPGSIPEYFHNDFQFRFVWFGKISGSYDAWHLDYVYLNRRVLDDTRDEAPDGINEFDQNTNISDRAISRPFTTIFNNGYYAMPYPHFLKDVPGNLAFPELKFFNLIDANFDQVVSYSLYTSITNFSDEVSTLIFNGYEETEGSMVALPSREYSTRQIQKLNSTNLSTPADSSKILVEVGFSSGDMDIGRDYFARYTPINFRLNDTISHVFTLSNYYAYDDGVAEYAMALFAQGNQFAYRFVMDDEVGEDMLNGAYIYFPYAGGAVPQTVQIFIFPDKAGKPDSAWIYRETVPVTRTANNLFTLIPFTQAVFVQDTFYIGYLETETGGTESIRIGLDASHDTGDQMYVRTTVLHQWQQNDQLVGTAMIRPRFGPGAIVTGIEDQPNPVSIYPNPNKGEFYMKGAVDNLQVITLTGQSVSYTLEQVQDTKKVMLQGTTPGLYIIRYRAGSKVYTDKILITE